MNLQTLGELVRDTRKTQGLKQAQVAERAGINRATLSRLENGTLAEMGVSKLERVLSVLGLAIEVGPARSLRPTLDELVEEQGRRAR